LLPQLKIETPYCCGFQPLSLLELLERTKQIGSAYIKILPSKHVSNFIINDAQKKPFKFKELTSKWIEANSAKKQM
jgi:hypothetical protein